MIKKEQPDRSKINIHQPYEVKYRTRALAYRRKTYRKQSIKSETRLPPFGRS